jgi:hypothetical protein
MLNKIEKIKINKQKKIFILKKIKKITIELDKKVIKANRSPVKEIVIKSKK